MWCSFSLFKKKKNKKQILTNKTKELRSMNECRLKKDDKVTYRGRFVIHDIFTTIKVNNV